MYRKLFYASLIFSLLLSQKAYCQQNVYRISFTDKNHTPYSLSSPAAYLSPRSIARRTAQGIAIDSTDIPVNQVYIDSVLHLTGGIFYESSRWLNFCVILLKDADTANIHNLNGRSFISDVALVGVYCMDVAHRSSGNTSNTQPPATAGKPTSLDGTYYSGAWNQIQLVNGNYLHDNGFDGSGKLIAVLDAGFPAVNTHPLFDSMWANNRFVDGYNFTYHSSDVFNYDIHGTQVLSTMAGYIPGTFVGTAPNALYALYITENEIQNLDDQPGELCNMIAGAERADSVGADVITSSLGYDVFLSTCNNQSFPQPFTSLDGKTTIAAKAANMATMKGILFVASAGNDGAPAIGGWGTHILTPGDADSALTIGATNYESYSPAAFSGYGPNAAGQIKPDVCAMGMSVTICNTSYNISTSPSLLSANDGTSFSTPQIAGLAACLWEAFPYATPYQIRQAIIRCASSYNNPGPQIGYGVPDFSCTQQALSVKSTPSPFTSANWVIADPNPFGADLRLSVSPLQDGNVDFYLTDIAGKKVFSSQVYFYKGYNAPYTISMPDLIPGIYLLKVVSSSQQQVIKLIKN